VNGVTVEAIIGRCPEGPDGLFARRGPLPDRSRGDGARGDDAFSNGSEHRCNPSGNPFQLSCRGREPQTQSRRLGCLSSPVRHRGLRDRCRGYCANS
jgi:hypothetical protein